MFRVLTDFYFKFVKLLIDSFSTGISAIPLFIF